MPQAAKDKMGQKGSEPGQQQQQQQQQQSSSSQSSSGEGEQKKSASKEVGKSEGSRSDYGSKGPQPKILNENPPPENDQAVKQHNEEMENRYERAAMGATNEEAKGDKVSKDFWSGQGGRDRDP